MTRDFLQGFLQKRFENRAARRTSTVLLRGSTDPLASAQKRFFDSFQGHRRVLKFPSLLSPRLQAQAKASARDLATPASRVVALVLQQAGAALAGMRGLRASSVALDHAWRDEFPW